MLELKPEAIWLVKAGPVAAVTVGVLGMPKATLSNWVQAPENGVLQAAGDKPVSVEPMALVRLRAERARTRMKREIFKTRRRTLLEHLCEVRLDRQPQGAVARHGGL